VIVDCCGQRRGHRRPVSIPLACTYDAVHQLPDRPPGCCVVDRGEGRITGLLLSRGRDWGVAPAALGGRGDTMVHVGTTSYSRVPSSPARAYLVTTVSGEPTDISASPPGHQARIPLTSRQA